jgi:hypothetical protein
VIGGSAWIGLALAMAWAGSAEATAARVEIRVTRSRGVAPLAVLFDATATTHPRFARSFHELRYAWDFGDPGAGTWALSGRDRHRAEGPVAGHLFERPGAYEVRLVVTDPAGGVAASSARIEVLDPAAHRWAAAYCYSNDTDHDGCPSGFTRVSKVTSFAGTLARRLGANTAHYFHRGHSFAMEPVDLARAGEVGIIGAYGTGERPVFTGRPIFVAGSDWRVVHLDLRAGAGGRPFGGDPTRPPDAFTVFDVEARGYGGCFEGFVAPQSPRVYQGLAIVDFRCGDLAPGRGRGWSIFLEARDAMLLGIDMDNCSPGGSSEGNVRFVFADTVVLQHSRLQRSCLNAAAKNPLSIRSCSAAKSPLRCPGGTPNRHVVVSDNVLGLSAGPSFIRTCTEEGCHHPGTVGNHSRDLIIERNYGFVDPRGDRSGFLWVDSQSGDITVRNNVVDMSASTWKTLRLAVASDRGPPDAGGHYRDHLHVHNNTLIVADASRRDVIGCASAIGSGHECKNNLLYAPGARAVTVADGRFDVAGNLSSGPPGPARFTGYPFRGGAYPGAPTSPSAFALAGPQAVTAGASPVGGGVVLASDDLDAALACRGVDAWDVGAFEYGARPCGSGSPAGEAALP